ncbi:urease accessory protein UreE [Azospirillum halopraeferens]|uniref:urease accessory protein UreE n=1 Tax=Azospirillum halopraeferens TaxID=34010 RepID=UPI000426043B|nr:urease accessory protein UreE [Azospirillum halopraeferens]
MLRRAICVHAAGTWDESRSAGTVTLAYDDRFRRRVRLTDDAGGEFLLDLPRAQVLADGDGLELDGGGVLRVRAAPERLAEVHCHDATEFARVAWHLGNRHLPVEIAPGVLRLPWDHVIVDMLHGLGAHVHEVQAPFTPEQGAYAGGGHHGHGH